MKCYKNRDISFSLISLTVFNVFPFKCVVTIKHSTYTYNWLFRNIKVLFMFCDSFFYCFGVSFVLYRWPLGPRISFQYLIRHLIIKSHQTLTITMVPVSISVSISDRTSYWNTLKSWDLYLEMCNCSKIWPAFWQHCCWCDCQISKWYNNLNYQSCSFSLPQDLTILETGPASNGRLFALCQWQPIPGLGWELRLPVSRVLMPMSYGCWLTWCRHVSKVYYITWDKMTSWDENTRYINGPLWGEPTSNWWFPLTKGQQCVALVFPLFFAWTSH